jgi:hypothetical protein
MLDTAKVWIASVSVNGSTRSIMISIRNLHAVLIQLSPSGKSDLLEALIERRETAAESL